MANVARGINTKHFLRYISCLNDRLTQALFLTTLRISLRMQCSLSATPFLEWHGLETCTSHFAHIAFIVGIHHSSLLVT